jgi:hypothetical protein
MGTMTRKEPHVVESQDRGELPGQPGKRPEVEVAAVQIMEMQDVGLERKPVQQVPRGRVFEILVTQLSTPLAAPPNGCLLQAARNVPEQVGQASRAPHLTN